MNRIVFLKMVGFFVLEGKGFVWFGYGVFLLVISFKVFEFKR